MLKILLRLCVLAIGVCYATSNCHELQKSQLASLHDRVSQMLNSLYTTSSSLSPTSHSATTPLTSSTNDTPVKDYAGSLPESYYTYPPFAVPPSQVIYVTPSHLPGIYGAPQVMYAPHSTVYSPPTFAPPPPIFIPSPMPAVPPTIPTLPAIAPPPAMYPPPSAMTFPPPPNVPPPPPPIQSPLYHLDAKQPYEQYRNVPPLTKSPWPQYYESYQQSPLPYSSPMPYSSPYPPNYPYPSDYSSYYPEYSSASIQYSTKPLYSGPPPAYSPPQVYQPPVPMPYPPIYP